MSTKPLITALGIAGLLPFMAALLATLTNTILGNIEPDLIFVFYSSVILSFLCGAFWGRLLTQPYSSKVATLLVATNLLALASWLSLLLVNEFQSLSLVLLSLAYFLVFMLEYIEVNLLYKNVYRTYIKLRFGLTSSVLVMHLIMLVVNMSSRI